MKKFHTCLLLSIFLFEIVSINILTSQVIVRTDSLVWYDASTITIEGRGWSDVLKPFDRLPKNAESNVRAPVWRLSRNSAGIAVHFFSDAGKIAARWKISNNTIFHHMTDVGIKGLDLYSKTPSDNHWRWAGIGRPEGLSNHYVLVKGLSKKMREYLLYLPLYDEIDSLLIGIDSTSVCKSFNPTENRTKPLLFYGTSITQGCSASRPGMAYPAIIGRALDVESINLGFSGNGRMDLEIASLIGTLDVSCYILDCLPNMTAEDIVTRTVPFVSQLRVMNPTAPIVLVENIQYTNSWIDTSAITLIQRKNHDLMKMYELLQKNGTKQLYYIASSDLIGTDDEGAIDGAHLTDIGMLRLSEKVIFLLKSLNLQSMR
jgi:hypothetical protein